MLTWPVKTAPASTMSLAACTSPSQWAVLFELQPIAGGQLALHIALDDDRGRVDIGLNFSLVGDVNAPGV